MEKFFKLKEHGSNVSQEILAGVTTFFAMSYIIFVNPMILSATGMNEQAVFLATIIAAIIGTLVMGLYANVPYAQAPGMGLNAFFTYTVVFAYGFTWQQALAMVFICGIINILITVTSIRKMIIKAIPHSLQNAISGGIGMFIAYIGIKNAGLLSFTSDPGNYILIGSDQAMTTAEAAASSTMVANSAIVPALVTLNTAGVLLALIGIVLTVIMLVKKMRGAIFVGIILTTLIGIPMGVTDLSGLSHAAAGSQWSALGETFGAAFTAEGMGSLFADPAKVALALITIFAFSLSDTFDTIGTFIGTGRRSGIFSKEDEIAMESSSGFKSKMDKALFADAIATSVGAVFGTSNTTTYVESAAGIGAGGRTGLTSVTVAALFALCSVFAPVVGIVPAQAVAPALIIVGVMMMASFKEIAWDDLDEAIPCFFTAMFMTLAYSISYGIAFGFVAYVIVKVSKGLFKDIHPILWISTLLFVVNFVMLALI